MRRVMLVTGSRFWDDAWTLKRVLDDVAGDAVRAGVTELVVRHGACYPPRDKKTRKIPARSADWLTHLWIAKFGPDYPIVITEQERPADWTAPCRPACKPGHRVASGTTMVCLAAGVHRNTDMVLEDPRPDIGVAFLRDNSTGTTHCVRTMREFSIPVEEIPYAPA